jgi:antitoxin component YwqK of YwqJK toxin-antitoxin module
MRSNVEVGRCTTEELEYPGDGLHYLDGKPFTGIIESRSPDGKLEGEEEYRDGLLSGRKRGWYPTGGLELEAECAEGVYHGKVREWYEDGRLAADAVYEHDIKLRRQAWDECGNLVEDYTLSESDPAFGILQAARSAQARYGARREVAERNAAPDPAGM